VNPGGRGSGTKKLLAQYLVDRPVALLGRPAVAAKGLLYDHLSPAVAFIKQPDSSQLDDELWKEV